MCNFAPINQLKRCEYEENPNADGSHTDRGDDGCC